MSLFNCYFRDIDIFGTFGDFNFGLVADVYYARNVVNHEHFLVPIQVCNQSKTF